MSGNKKRIPKKKPDHESGFYEECPAEYERCTRSSFNVNSRTSEDNSTKMKKTIKNNKNNRKKSDIIPPNGFTTPDKKKEEKLPPVAPAIDDYVLILSSDSEEDEGASTSNGYKEKIVRPESVKSKAVVEKKAASTVASSYIQSDKELEQISRIKKYGGMSSFFFTSLSLSYLFYDFMKMITHNSHVCLFIGYALIKLYFFYFFL